jgi:hypothetical protein
MRILVPALATLVAGTRAPIAGHLLRLTIGETTLYYAERAEIVDGHPYLAYLRVIEFPRYVRSLGTLTARVSLSAADLSMATMLGTYRDSIQGAAAVLARWYPEVMAEDLLLTGRVGAARIAAGGAAIELELIGPELDTVQIPLRVYQPLCSHRFKNAASGCPSEGVATSCDKTFADCSHASRNTPTSTIQAFDGVATITRELTEVVEGNQRLPSAGESAGADDGRQQLYMEP